MKACSSMKKYHAADYITCCKKATNKSRVSRTALNINHYIVVEVDAYCIRTYGADIKSIIANTKKKYF
jgi:hypothetical protein